MINLNFLFDSNDQSWLFLTFYELPAYQVLVYSVKGQKLLVPTSLFDFSTFKHNDFICVANRAQPVGHDDNSLLALLNQQIQGLLDLVLTFSVKSTRRLV